MITVLAFLLAAAIGYLIVRLLAPAAGLGPRWAVVLLEVSLGTGLGAALTSVLFIGLLATGAASTAIVWIVELLLLAALGAVVWKKRGGLTPEESSAEPAGAPGWRYNKALAGLLAIAMLLVIAAQIDTAKASPHGEFDAFAMWNARARILLGSGDTWQNAWSPMLERQRPDHPLLLPLFVARGWRLGVGPPSPVSPFAAAMLFFYACMGILAASVVLFRGLSSALLALLLFISATSFLQQSAWEYADIPMALFVLGAVVLLLLSVEATGRRKTSALILSGAFASFAALTKNEGIPFLLLMFALYVALQWRTAGVEAIRKTAPIWLLGALPGALLQAGFKLFLAPSGGPFAGPSISQAFGFLGEFDRYETVVRFLIGKAILFGSGFTHPVFLLIILAVALRLNPNGKYRPYQYMIGALLCLLLLTYCGVYLTTLDEITWRLDTSLGRLYSHLWPTFVLLVFLALRVPRDERTEEESPAKHPAGGKSKKRKRRAKN